MINFAKRQVVANRYLSALGHSISILSYFQVEEKSGDHLASICLIDIGKLKDRSTEIAG